MFTNYGLKVALNYWASNLPTGLNLTLERIRNLEKKGIVVREGLFREGDLGATLVIMRSLEGKKTTVRVTDFRLCLAVRQRYQKHC